MKRSKGNKPGEERQSREKVSWKGGEVRNKCMPEKNTSDVLKLSQRCAFFSAIYMLLKRLIYSNAWRFPLQATTICANCRWYHSLKHDLSFCSFATTAVTGSVHDRRYCLPGNTLCHSRQPASKLWWPWHLGKSGNGSNDEVTFWQKIFCAPPPPPPNKNMTASYGAPDWPMLKHETACSISKQVLVVVTYLSGWWFAQLIPSTQRI